MEFSKKILTIALVVIIVGAGAAYLLLKNRGSSVTASSEDAEGSEQKVAASAIPVKVAEVRRGDLVITLKSPGEAVTNMQVDLKAEVAGRVKQIHVKESQRVKKGDILLELDDREYRLQLDNSEATRLEKLSKYLLETRFGTGEESAGVSTGNSRSKSVAEEFEKIRGLYERGLISFEEYQQERRKLDFSLIDSGEKRDTIMRASQGVTQAEVAVERARLDLEKTKVRAPFSGIVTNIQISPGQNISAGTDLFTLVNIDRIQVNAKVLESEIGKMKVGREVDLKFSAYPGQTFKGTVQAISPLVDPEDKTCNVIINVANIGESVKPGMHAEVEIAAEIYTDRLLVPQDAVITRSGRKLVFVVEGELAKWKYVNLGLENEDFAEILKSDEAGGEVKEGDQVIIEGHFTMAHDARVRISQ